MCGSDGQWGEIDFTNCTMDLNSSPFIHIEFQLSAYNFTDSLVNMIRDRVCMFVHNDIVILYKYLVASYITKTLQLPFLYYTYVFLLTGC